MVIHSVLIILLQLGQSFGADFTARSGQRTATRGKCEMNDPGTAETIVSSRRIMIVLRCNADG